MNFAVTFTTVYSKCHYSYFPLFVVMFTTKKIVNTMSLYYVTSEYSEWYVAFTKWRCSLKWRSPHLQWLSLWTRQFTTAVICMALSQCSLFCIGSTKKYNNIVTALCQCMTSIWLHSVKRIHITSHFAAFVNKICAKNH